MSLPGVSLAYRQSGTGPDIVWLAAGDHPGTTGAATRRPAFDDGYRSTTYDARGVGATRLGHRRPGRSTSMPSTARR